MRASIVKQKIAQAISDGCMYAKEIKEEVKHGKDIVSLYMSQMCKEGHINRIYAGENGKIPVYMYQLTDTGCNTYGVTNPVKDNGNAINYYR